MTDIDDPVRLLTKVKKDLKICADKWEHLGNTNDLEYEKCRHIIMKICEEDNINIPNVISSCLEMEEFLTYAFEGSSRQSDVVLFIQDTFNPFIDIVKKKSIKVQFIPVTFTPPDNLTYYHIKEELIKCDKKIIEQDYAGAITNARSLLEGVLKEIIFSINGEHPDPKKDLVKLLNDARNSLNLDPSKPDLIDPLKQVITGLTSTVQGLGTLRNVISDSHSRKYEPDAHHAILAVNASKTIASFLFGTFEYQKSKGFLKLGKGIRI